MTVARDLFALVAAWPKAARVALVAAGIVLTIAAIAVPFGRPTSVPLFANPLQTDQVSEVEEQLAAWHVAFVPQSDNVYVDRRQRSTLLLRLSLVGVPHEHVESSQQTLQKIGTLTPQSVVDAETQRGVEGDVELALRGMAGIDEASVIVAAARPALYADENSREATAAVRLRLQAGARLSRDAIAGIRKFVAAAVSGLNPERITIVDDRGVALDEGAAQTDDAEIEGSLQSALDAALGAGAALVRVRIEYDPRHDTVHDVKRTAIGGPPISAEHLDERFVSHDTRYAKASHSDERGTELHDVQSDISAPRVARISVAIAVAPQFAPQSPEIRNLAIAAAGLNLQRGDAITVQAFPFQRTLREKKDAWWLAYGALVTFAPKIIVALAVLVAARWAGPPLAEGCAALGRRARIAHARSALEDVPARQVHGVLAGEPPHAAAAIISALPAATAAAVLDLFPPEERTAIVRRMSRTRSALIPDYEALLADG